MAYGAAYEANGTVSTGVGGFVQAAVASAPFSSPSPPTCKQRRIAATIDTKVLVSVAPVATVMVVAAGLLAGQIEGLWLTKIRRRGAAYFALRFNFPPKTQQRTTEQSIPLQGSIRFSHGLLRA